MVTVVKGLFYMCSIVSTPERGLQYVGFRVPGF